MIGNLYVGCVVRGDCVSETRRLPFFFFFVIDGTFIILPQEIVNLNCNWLLVNMACLTTAGHNFCYPLAIVEHILSHPLDF